MYMPMTVYQIFLYNFINPVPSPLLKMETVLIVDMLGPMYQKTLHHTPEDSSFHGHIRKVIKSHTVLFILF
jgi:hypothetical protein